MLGAEDGGDQDEDAFLVMPENWDGVRVFLALSRCWRVDGFNGLHLGLDRPAIESTLRLMAIPADRHRDIFEDLRIMESAALPALNKG